LIEKIAAFFGKSQFLYLQLFFFVSWAICSDFAPQLLPFNLPEFDLEGMGIDIASLLIGTGVLVQQNRQDKLSEQRSHLMLQMNLLTEQKIAKLKCIKSITFSAMPQKKWRCFIFYSPSSLGRA
jgi:uncharacterized membrane protein